MILPAGRPAIMGILNMTPDSFSDGGLYAGAQPAVEAGLRMVEDGADLIDVGGESTRPGAEPVSFEEELARVLPVVSGLAQQGVPVSIDTMKPDVARACLDAGAFLVNDVTGLRSAEMIQVCASAGCFVCIMHMRGEPRTMQQDPHYADVVSEVKDFLVSRAEEAMGQGIDREKIWIDPGIGFGKKLEHNLELLRGLPVLAVTGYPILVGASRKSFIGKVLGGLGVEDRLEGTLAVQAWAQLHGARVLRVHDVKAARRNCEMIAALSGS